MTKRVKAVFFIIFQIFLFLIIFANYEVLFGISASQLINAIFSPTALIEYLMVGIAVVLIYTALFTGIFENLIWTNKGEISTEPPRADRA